MRVAAGVDFVGLISIAMHMFTAETVHIQSKKNNFWHPKVAI